MAPAPNLQDLIETVRRDAPTGDPLDLLATASTTAVDLSTAGDALLDHYVDGARRAGRSWSEISGVLGVTKQAAHKRYGAGIPNSLARFTDRARAVLVAATDAARELGHPYVGTEHFLLGLLTDPNSLAGKVLDGAGITAEAVRAAVIERAPQGEPVTTTHLPHTKLARVVLAATLNEALELGHDYIGTEHLLLGLYGAPEGWAAQILLRLGLDRDTARERIIALLVDLRPA